jgi:energy-coupling factor transporter ATP-binding protein EcfA2
MTTKETVRICIYGPVGSGKSIVLAAIQDMLHRDFGIVAESPDLEQERRLSNPDTPTKAEKEKLRNYTWLLNESCPTSNLSKHDADKMYFDIEASLQRKQGLHKFANREDGLYHYLVCGGAEGSLPTDCPQVLMTADQRDAVYSGKLDHIDGTWFEPEKGKIAHRPQNQTN